MTGKVYDFLIEELSSFLNMLDSLFDGAEHTGIASKVLNLFYPSFLKDGDVVSSGRHFGLKSNKHSGHQDADDVCGTGGR